MSDEKDLAEIDAIVPADVEDVAPIMPPYRPLWGVTGMTGPLGTPGLRGVTGMTGPFQTSIGFRTPFEDQEFIKNTDPAGADLEWTPPGMNINED
jgi:hypothetical protein